MRRPSWDVVWFLLCDAIAQRSRDTTKIGCVIIGENQDVKSIGYNGMPRGINDSKSKVPERFKKPQKYFWFEHAERNAIYNASRIGIPLKNCIMYTQGIPCADCARAIIQTGIVVVKYKYIIKGWENKAEITFTMFREAGIKIIKI